jgi:hypothetical protein
VENVQYKMILKPGLFPIQDDPEIVSLPRYEVDADSNGKCTDADTGSDQRISRWECGGRVYREPGGEVRVDRGHIEQQYFALSKRRRGIVCALLMQDSGIEHTSDHAPDTLLPAKRRDSATDRIVATICREVVHNGGFGVAD